MELLHDYLLWIITIFLLIFSYWKFKTPPGLPPGPIGYPVIGSLLSITKTPHIKFIQMANKYGNIFHLYFGSRLVIVLNDFESIKEAFLKQANTFSGRILDEQYSLDDEPYQGMILADGEYWREHRRFILHNLRDNGVGKLTLEPLLLNEIQFFLAELRRHSGRPHDVRRLLMCSLVNNVFLLITGQRFDYDNELFKKTVEMVAQIVRLTPAVALQTFFPWIKHISGIILSSKIKQRSQTREEHFKIVRELLESALKRNDTQYNDTYAKAYFEERNKRLEQHENERIFTEIGLFFNGRELVNAGGETSSNTLLWSMLYMTFHPEVQKRVQQEIDRVIGREREPTYTDRFMTPYTEATIMELHRVISLAPLGLPHRNIKETTLFGYNIPQSCMILANMYAVNHDPKLWGDPDNFRPERFIGPDGKLNKPEYFIPFSIGKRACLGEPLASMEVYLYFVSIMQNFEVIPAEGVDQSLESFTGAIRQSVCGTICVKPR